MDGNMITGRRTVATSALAARILALPDSSRLLVLGAGRIGSRIPEAYRAVLPIDEVTVWSPIFEEAEALVARLRPDGMTATVADDLETAVREADIVSAATLATEPQIGRASCRERVCQYLYIPGVPVSLKQKLKLHQPYRMF